MANDDACLQWVSTEYICMRTMQCRQTVYKLKKKPYHQNPLIPEEIKDFMDIEDHPKFFQDNWSNHTTQYFTQGDYGEDLGVEVYKFEDLPDRWHEICDKCQIPRCELPHLNSS